MTEEEFGDEFSVPVPRKYDLTTLDLAIDHVTKYVLDALELGAAQTAQPSEAWRAGFVEAHLVVRKALDQAYAEVQQ